MPYGLGLEVEAFIGVRGSHDGDHLPLSVEYRGIEEICRPRAHILPSDIVSPVLIDDVLEGFLVHPGSQEHPVEHFRSGGPEFLSSSGVEGDVGLHRAADVFQHGSRLLGVECGIVSGIAAPCLDQSLQGVDLVRHRIP